MKLKFIFNFLKKKRNYFTYIGEVFILQIERTIHQWKKIFKNLLLSP